MMNRLLFLLVFIFSTVVFSQTNNLTGSPYSLFGLGVNGNSNTGKYKSLGKTGIALSDTLQINTNNPASFSNLIKKGFFLDVGSNAELNNLSDNADKNEKRISWNFSNVSMALNTNGKSGFGLSLTPATSVGYTFLGVKKNIEGSQEQFTSNIIGSGALNELSLNYGHKLLKNFSIGINTSYLFGKIDETENIILEESLLNIQEETYYLGLQLGLGVQYKFKNKFIAGATINFPSILRASQDKTIIKSTGAFPSQVEEKLNINATDFRLPLEIGFGLNYSLDKRINLTADIKHNYWSTTSQSDNIGKYIDQTIVGVGGEFTLEKNSLKYWKKINYRLGLNYDSGYLKINNNIVNSYEASIGIGLPFNRNKSMLNLSYTRGNRGEAEGILINENYNQINMNLTLSDIWFKKRKYQ